jgi:hypothetical protein
MVGGFSIEIMINITYSIDMRAWFHEGERTLMVALG